MDKLFSVENAIKKKHLGLMISVRDILNKSQREFLDKVKEEQGWQHGPFHDEHGFMSDDPLMPRHGPPTLAFPPTPPSP
jgi:hypothetical protein